MNTWKGLEAAKHKQSFLYWTEWIVLITEFSLWVSFIGVTGLQPTGWTLLKTNSWPNLLRLFQKLSKILKKSPVMEVFIGTCRLANYSLLQSSMFLKFRKNPEIMPAVEILFAETDAKRFSSSYSKQLFGEFPGQSCEWSKRTPPSVFYCEVVAADAQLRMLRFPSERLKYNCRVSVNFNLEVLETFDYYFSVSAQSNPRLHILIS